MRPRRSGLFLVLAFAFAGAQAGAQPTGATAPLDYTRRNEAFAPVATIVPERRLPDADRILPSPRRLHPAATEKISATAGDHPAPITVAETRAKRVIEPEVPPPPEAQAKPLSIFNGRKAHIPAAAAFRTLPLAAKYRDRRAAADAASIEQVSLSDRGLLSRINRFVFRKNRPESRPASIIPAGNEHAKTKDQQ